VEALTPEAEEGGLTGLFLMKSRPTLENGEIVSLSPA
jgi:hypothetical protein